MEFIVPLHFFLMKIGASPYDSTGSTTKVTTQRFQGLQPRPHAGIWL